MCNVSVCDLCVQYVRVGVVVGVSYSSAFKQRLSEREVGHRDKNKVNSTAAL